MIKKIIFFAGFAFLTAALSWAEVWKAPDQEKAKERAKQVVPFIKEYKDDCIVNRKICLMEAGISMKDVTDVYFLLDSPIIKKREDHYGPVRFSHKRHANLTNDCSKCHHYRPKDENELETTRCSACHQDSFNPDHPERIGLKAAYHQQCMECHKQEAKGPVDCKGCHLQNVPNHKELVNLPDNPDVFQVTAECLRCHDSQGEDMLTTAHWLWKGPSPYTTGHRKDIMHGKGTTAINNY
jgi:hypothetical protein